jgi:hypothetical protein
MRRAAQWSLLIGLALGPRAAFAAETPAASGEPSPPRREITLGLAYGPIVSPRAITTYEAAGAPVPQSIFTGWMLEVTGRRFASFEYGFLAWSTGGSSNGKGSYAHVLVRFAAEARWLPWGFGRVEPWLGAEIGIAAADDYAKWDATQVERAHSAKDTRFGYAAGALTGVRARVSDFVAFGLRGGALYMDLTRARGPVSEPGDTEGAYAVYPTDYARRIWYSMMLSAELTVPD